MTKAGWIGAAAAALMVGASMAMPPMGQRHTPRFVPGVQYDSNGHKVKPKAHPRHSRHRKLAKSNSGFRDFAEFRAAVMSTHRDLPGGLRQQDPRDDKYLHSHARGMRGLVRALDRRSAA